MKSSSLICFLALGLFFSCRTAPQAQAPAPKPVFVTWDKKLVELGPVKKGETRSMVFEFTNPGPETVQLEAVSACDCTTVDYPRGPLAPGQKGRIDVIFDSKDKDAAETIDIDLIFKNTDEKGIPRIERVSYHFDLVK